MSGKYLKKLLEIKQSRKIKLITFVICDFELFFIGDPRNNSSAEDQKHLALLVMETLTVLLQGSTTNAGNQEGTELPCLGLSWAPWSERRLHSEEELLVH